MKLSNILDSLELILSMQSCSWETEFGAIKDALRWRNISEERPTEEGHYLVKRKTNPIPEVALCFTPYPLKSPIFTFEDEITHWKAISGPEVGK